MSVDVVGNQHDTLGRFAGRQSCEQTGTLSAWPHATPSHRASMSTLIREQVAPADVTSVMEDAGLHITHRPDGTTIAAAPGPDPECAYSISPAARDIFGSIDNEVPTSPATQDLAGRLEDEGWDTATTDRGALVASDPGTGRMVLLDPLI